MSRSDDAGAAGRLLLRRRLDEIPAALELAPPWPDLPFDPRSVRRWVTTGIGSSEGHARHLAGVLWEQGEAASFLPTGMLTGLGAPVRDDVLVVFSQGLSPNARAALARPERWRAVVLLTAASEDEANPADKRAALARLRACGGVVLPFPGADEYGTLVRVVGPMAGFAAAHRLAARIVPRWEAPAGAGPAERVRALVDGADRALVDRLANALARRPVLVTDGAARHSVHNLQLKVLEGFGRPFPAAWHLLDVAHGPLQEAWGEASSFVLLNHPRSDRTALERLRGSTDPGRHEWIELEATLPPPLAVFEHETLFNLALLAFVDRERRDPTVWPGQGKDGPLYDFVPEVAAAPVPPRPVARLADRTSPEMAAALERGEGVAVWPLGSTEQHGAHLPLGTDTALAVTLAERVASAIDGSSILPALPIGCADEHLGFTGTLSIRADTLCAVLEEVAAAVAESGFAWLVVVNAHGGNAGALGEWEASRADGATPHVVVPFDGRLPTAEFWAASGAASVPPAASGYHAGEFETALLDWSSGRVRRDRVEAGPFDPATPPVELFYPRVASANGVVGDATGYAATHGGRYLTIWADAIVEVYERARNRKKTNGTKNP